MPSFQLFRTKVLRTAQVTIDDAVDPVSPRRALEHVLESRPSADLRRGHTWHVGNITSVDDDAVYFRLGRTTRTTLELYDEDTSNFVDEEFTNAPYTHVVLDLNVQVAAIAAKNRLAPSVPGIARQFARLLNTDRWAKTRELEFRIDPIQDPESFLQQLRRAHQVLKFSVDFSRPNPWDVEQDFQKPMQRLLQEAAGRAGRTSISGEKLEVAPLERLARAAAASGDDASATLRPAKSSRPVIKSLRNNPVTLTAEDLATVKQMRGVVGRIRELYHHVRDRITPR